MKRTLTFEEFKSSKDFSPKDDIQFHERKFHFHFLPLRNQTSCITLHISDISY